MVALNIELAADFDGPFGARRDTKPAPFTQLCVDPDKALLQRRISRLICKKVIFLCPFTLFVKTIEAPCSKLQGIFDRKER
jgi:hypothetical protein